MNKLKTLILLVLLYALAPTTAFTQDISTQGKEFWVSFMGNGFKDHPNYGTWLRIQLLISAKDACSCTIQNPRTGWQQTVDIEANSTYLFENRPTTTSSKPTTNRTGQEAVTTITPARS